MSYVQPEQVVSPKQHWALISVLDPGAENSTALAIGRWDGKPRLGMRWNGNDENPVGNPQSRGLATWFLLEEKYHDAILNSGIIAPAQLSLVRELFQGQEKYDLRFADFYRYKDPMKRILNDLIASGGQKQYDPNHDIILHGHLIKLQSMQFIHKVDGEEPVTYAITALGREKA